MLLLLKYLEAIRTLDKQICYNYVSYLGSALSAAHDYCTTNRM